MESGRGGSLVEAALATEGVAKLLGAIAECGLHDDLRSIWGAYPNLEDATHRLLNKISIAWPARAAPEDSAVVAATIKAVRAVKECITNGDRSRAQVVGVYLAALASVADDVATVRAFGCLGKNEERWTLEDADLLSWVHAHGFSELKFFPVDDPNPNELAGTRMKLLCAIASTRDVGLVGRYH